VRLDPDNDERVRGDIQRFIANSVQKLESIQGFNDICKSVETALLSRAQGTFLWIGFVMEELSRKKTCTEILEALDDIPVGLHAIYDRMLLQIESSRQPVILEILQWVTIAVRPLTLRELTTAIRIPSTTEISSNQAIRDYITLCGHILTIQNQRVSLIHQSARDYLLQEKVNNGPKPKEFRIKAEEAHARMARICLDYIEKSDFRYEPVDINDESVLQKSPLLHYASMHWPEHARRSLYADKDINLSRPFFQEKSNVRMHWWETYAKANSIRWLLSIVHLLHIVSYLGIDSMVWKLLTTNAWHFSLRKPVNQKDERGETALSLAAEGGHETTVQLLLAHGADANDYRALWWAAEGGHEAIIQLLLANGADGKDIVLRIAAYRGNEAIVQLLITNGVNVNAMDISGMTALKQAAGRGHEPVVRLLIENGAEVNADGFLNNTALSKAAEGGHEAIVQLLLANGADINDYKALSKAAEGGREAIIELLLANGANVNIKDKYGRTALSEAAKRGHKAVAQLLLNINAEDEGSEDSYIGLRLIASGGPFYFILIYICLYACIYASTACEVSNIVDTCGC
jgi:ankyrin repeat protein